jgi:hypothetical protein
MASAKALIDQVIAEKQANVRLTCEIFDRCHRLQVAAATEGDEATMWAAATEARRARRAFDQISANLDRLIARLEAQGST